MRSSAGPDLEQQARWSFMLDASKQAQSLIWSSRRAGASCWTISSKRRA